MFNLMYIELVETFGFFRLLDMRGQITKHLATTALFLCMKEIKQRATAAMCKLHTHVV